MRKNLFGPTEAIYSDYTCYTGIADFVPADIETVGYASSHFHYILTHSVDLASLLAFGLYYFHIIIVYHA